MIKFAIVIPNYNQSHFLPSALESLRHQSVSFTLAVMDGGSTDNFEGAVKPYSDIIQYLRSAPDGGQAAAIREGFDRIPGEIVAWLNADDYYFPHILEHVADCFEEDPTLDVVYGDAIHVTKEGFFLSYFPPIQDYEARDLTRTCFICQPACFVRRSVYERIGGVDASLMFTMDWDLWCRLAKSGAKFKYLREPLAAVRYYQGTKTLSGSRKRYGEIWRIEREYGGRLFPRTWPGFYLYGLMCKSDKTIYDTIILNILKSVRSLKGYLVRSTASKRNSRKALYGFNRWDPLVSGRCTIHLPWYDKRQWKKINLSVEPRDKTFEIAINDGPAISARAKGRFLSIDVPPMDDPYRKISISCHEEDKWQLLDFQCELK